MGMANLTAQMPSQSLIPLNSEARMQPWSDEEVLNLDMPDGFRRIVQLKDGRIISQASRTAINYQQKDGTWAKVNPLPTAVENNTVVADQQSRFVWIYKPVGVRLGAFDFAPQKYWEWTPLRLAQVLLQVSIVSRSLRGLFEPLNLSITPLKPGFF